MSRLEIKKGTTLKTKAQEAIEDIYNQIYSGDNEYVFLFISSRYDLKKLAKEINKKFPKNITACTTSGELSPLGYIEGSITGFSLKSPNLKVVTHTIKELQNFNLETIKEINQNHLNLHQELDSNYKSFGFLQIDGLSIAEESVAGTISSVINGLEFFGASAGDDLAFDSTYIYNEGEFIKDAATLSIFYTTHPFKLFKMQHFEPDENLKLVITEAKAPKRIVTEINGLPAAEEYARLINVEIGELTPSVFSKHPLMIKVGGDYFVRSIQKVNEDLSLTFFCAIEEGLVLTIAQNVDMIKNLDSELERITKDITPQLIIGSECILRRLEILENNLHNDAAEVMNKYNVVGFHTYGEQINGLHVNQTFTGVVLGVDNE